MIEVEIEKNLQVDEIIYENIPVINCDITYNEFFKNFLCTNQACIIKNVSINWEATKYWVCDNKPNLKYLSEKYGDCVVTVYDCNSRYINSQKSAEKVFDDYVEYLNGSCRNQLLYLKDWHLKKAYPEDNFYEVPLYFVSDWLNEYCDDNKLDDFKFVYIGPEESWTPFHADVYHSYSWSVNICGQKKWLLYPPGEENCLRDPFGNLPYDVEFTLDTTYFEVIQNPGEAIFVPSGWHHQVKNLTPTISINQNWINACNIKTVWYELDKGLKNVKKEFEDCDDMENFIDHCQLTLHSVNGMDFAMFYDLIKCISLKRIKLLLDDAIIKLPHDRFLGKNHALFDLKAIQPVLEIFIKHSDLNEISEFNNVSLSPQNLLNQINSALLENK